MPLHHAVLALLSTKPAHGYELKSSFEQAVGDNKDTVNSIGGSLAAPSTAYSYD